MAEPSTGRVEYAYDSSEPIIEDITELCDFCVKLTEKTLRGCIELFAPDITPGNCQLCEVILRRPYTTDLSVRTHHFWDIGQRESRRISAFDISGNGFAIWANLGKKLGI